MNKKEIMATILTEDGLARYNLKMIGENIIIVEWERLDRPLIGTEVYRRIEG